MTRSQALEHLWQAYCRDGFPALESAVPETAGQAFYLSMLAFGHERPDLAIQHMQRALQFEPQNPVFQNALPCLQSILDNQQTPVYSAQEAFSAYVNGGGNIPLYQQVSAALGLCYQDYTQLHLLDIGAGDGQALLPALNSHVSMISLVEPSQAMLSVALTRLAQTHILYQAYAERFQDFICHTDTCWPLAQATFSLQSIPPHERRALLKWLSTHCRRLLLVEFDVPYFEHIYHPKHVCSVLQRMQTGLEEYEQERERVAQGFMMPVMLGFFDHSTVRTNYEQPLTQWLQQVEKAGFSHVAVKTLYEYWWAPVFLIDARP